MEVYRLPRPLDEVELRVLGCLIEKELSTPDAYPLSLAALTAACNQRSNRQPVVELTADEIEEALARLLPEVLVWRVRSSRVLRWQHNLDSKWSLDRPRKAILAELLLRGPQTSGELRNRCARMISFGSLGEVEEHLSALAEADPALAEVLGRQPGQKETRWAHRLGETPTVVASTPPPPRERQPVPPPGRLDELENRVARLESQIARLLDSLGESSG